MTTSSLQTAVQIKEAITNTTGLLARVSVQNGEFTASPLLPGTERQLSIIQCRAIHAVYQNRSGADDGCGMNAALSSGAFESRTQAETVMANLATFGWLRVTGPNRYALTEKSTRFINRRLGETPLNA